MLKKRLFCLCLGLFSICFAETAIQQTPHKSQKGVLIRVLDKFTNEKKELRLPLNTPTKEGTLTISAKCCFSTPPEEPPEHTAFIEIIEEKTVDSTDTSSIPERSYQNWMFASAPSITPFEHAQYHISVVQCVNDSSQKQTTNA